MVLNMEISSTDDTDHLICEINAFWLFKLLTCCGINAVVAYVNNFIYSYTFQLNSFYLVCLLKLKAIVLLTNVFEIYKTGNFILP